MKLLKNFLSCAAIGLMMSLPLSCKAMAKPGERKELSSFSQLIQGLGIRQPSLEGLKIEIVNPEISRARRNRRDEERKRYAEYMGDFNWKSANHILDVIEPLMGDKRNMGRLVALVKFLGKESGIEVDKLATRRKDCAIKWLDNNWEMLEPYIVPLSYRRIVFEGDEMKIN